MYGLSEKILNLLGEIFKMNIKNYGKYWTAGLFIAGITGAVSFFVKSAISYSQKFVPLWFGKTLELIIGLFVLFVVLWGYGKLIKIIYEKFNLKDY
ncbi:hypothetical protein [Methanobacterium paludis]|uniref:Uncharacterized protein n=1 Tax=Methanobacterium paludis (strain DSM 25820 / JCM 18151 / SWAN1) TaxID=868131 RepID=F6D4T9_METPW|nr:hypothetical protein [Methanobacterium paludis]AEG18148.1 hypothetical protein MSWAN_1129 [Methanobacterium paludis]